MSVTLISASNYLLYPNRYSQAASTARANFSATGTGADKTLTRHAGKLAEAVDLEEKLRGLQAGRGTLPPGSVVDIWA